MQRLIAICHCICFAVVLACALVPGVLSAQTTVALRPDTLNMVVGETRTIQAVDHTGAVVHGLTWSSSDAAIASLSAEDPPTVMALAPGQVTITAGDGSATLTVYPGPVLPPGTVKWSTSGDGSGLYYAIPAVPSPTGVADVFAFGGSGTVQAITSDGTVAWTAPLGSVNALLPDFQGGLVVVTGQSVQSLDGTSGQASPAYSARAGYDLYGTLVHTDGTILTVDGDTVVGIDPATGTPKFTIHLEDSVSSGNGNCGEYTPYESSSPPEVGQGIIAGDGYAYFPYWYSLQPLASNTKSCEGDGEVITTHRAVHARVLRVGTDGSFTKLVIADWTADASQQCIPGPPYTGYGECANGYWVNSASGMTPYSFDGSLITNADQGVLYSWEAAFWDDSSYSTQTQYALTSLSAQGTSATTAQAFAGQTGPVQPVLQTEDGTFIGTVSTTETGYELVAFAASGTVYWSLPGYYYQPLFATSDGSVVARSWTAEDGLVRVTVDHTGHTMAQVAEQGLQGQQYSWTGGIYTI
jgi:hypothetical protein